VAVSKTKPIEAIQEAWDAGQRYFGENYIQELVEKSQSFDKLGVQWHFIGHLQSNKAKLLLDVKNLAVVESVDSYKLARKLNSLWASRDSSLRIFVQVNTSGEATKSGVKPEETVELVEKIKRELLKLEFAGLMSIGSSDQKEFEDFKVMARLKHQLCQVQHLEPQAVELSMGMSADFQDAIKFGATNVRVGSTVFGERLT